MIDPRETWTALEMTGSDWSTIHGSSRRSWQPRFAEVMWFIAALVWFAISGRLPD